MARDDYCPTCGRYHAQSTAKCRIDYGAEYRKMADAIKAGEVPPGTFGLDDNRDICPTCGRFGAKPKRVNLPPEAFTYEQLIAEARTLVEWQATDSPLLARLADALESTMTAMKPPQQEEAR